LIISYAKDMGANFVSYAAEILEILIPLFKFYFHEGVRTAAAAAVPPVLASVKLAGEIDSLRQVWSSICPQYISVLAHEEDDTFTLQLFNSFAECLEIVGENSMTDEQMTNFTAAAVEQMDKYYQRMKDREEARKAQELDEDDEEQLAEEELIEGLTIDEVAKAVHAVLKTHGVKYLQFTQPLLHVAHKYLAEQDSSARQWAICVFDDLVEFGGPASWQIAGDFLQPIITAVQQDSAPDLRQAAAYGIGIMAQYGGDAYLEFLVSVGLPSLLAVISSPNARSEENVYATENAVAAIAKLLRAHSGKLPDAQGVLQAWFQALPISNDEEEAPGTYSYLLQILSEQPDLLLRGNDPVAVKHLVKVLAEGLAVCSFEQQLEAAMVEAMKKTIGSLDDSVKAALWTEIPPEQQQALQEKNYL
ncbi:importin subunit beta-3, partial [Linderina pennispora]